MTFDHSSSLNSKRVFRSLTQLKRYTDELDSAESAILSLAAYECAPTRRLPRIVVEQRGGDLVALPCAFRGRRVRRAVRA